MTESLCRSLSLAASAQPLLLAMIGVDNRLYLQKFLT
jgi:hypothetical protein